MLLSLPPELVRAVAKSCPLGTQASLVCTCKRLYETCNPILYMCDVQDFGSSSVFHAIARCADESVALGTLKAAAKGGADFKHCQDFHGVRSFLQEPSQIAIHSPLCLAASRGLNHLVAFLLDRGVPPDGPGGVVTPPLFQAIANKRDFTAAWLASRGASLLRPGLLQNALHAAIVNGLPTLTAYLARCTSLDINVNTVAGQSSIVLALRSGEPSMVPHVISLGADVREPVWQLCQNHNWVDVVGLLNAGSVHLARALETHGCLDLVVFVATRKVPSYYKDMQIAAIDRIITLQRALESGSQGEKDERPKEFLDMLEGLLQRMLSIHRADLPIASILLRHGVGIRPGIYVDLLEALDQMKSSNHTRRRRIVCQHRKLLKSFDFVFSYCSSISPEKRDATMGYFLRRVPIQVVELVQQMKNQNLPLTEHSLQKMENETAPGGESGPPSQPHRHLQ